MVKNFMGGESFEYGALETLKMVSASSIFGEPSYYRESRKGNSYVNRSDKNKEGYSLFKDLFEGRTTEEIFEKAIDDSLEEDFKDTLDWAIMLRNDFNMRLNPQVILVRASKHPKRAEFNKENPNYFKDVVSKVATRGDDLGKQLDYYKSINEGSVRNLPNVLKRSWKNELEKMSPYVVNKYKGTGHLIDLVRISHAKGDVITQLMTDTLEVQESSKSMVQFRSEGKSWEEIMELGSIPHMALVRSLTSILEEFSTKYIEGNEEISKKMDNLLKDLVNGAEGSKLFPYRYYNAYEMVKSHENSQFKEDILDAISQALDNSLNNLPKLEGKTMVLSDNSGSAWGGFATEYGRVVVAEIGNLSAVITAFNSDEGKVGVFGDRLIEIDIDKNKSVLKNLEKVNKVGKSVGMATEQGLFDFFANSIDKGENYDNIFIYSDMQAGHNHLYGTNSMLKLYKDKEYAKFQRHTYWDFNKLVDFYREHINKKVNIYSVQTGGYDNALMPEYAYRSNLISGWTGKELEFADAMNKLWNRVDKTGLY